MARRRNRFRRISPERGWLVGSDFSNFTVPENPTIPNDPPGLSQILPVFQFNEIDNDEGVIVAHDKSEWFVQRILLDVFFQLNTDGDPEGTLPPRIIEWALVTADNAELVDYITEPGVTGQGGPPICDTNYDRYARILHTATGVVTLRRMHYRALAAGTIERVTTAGTTVNWGDFDVAWAEGRDKFCLDIDPKVALRPDQSCAIVFGGRTPSTVWASGGLEAGDNVFCQALWRILLQKRRK